MPRSFVKLPANIRGPFEVYVNGVPQREGVDYKLAGRELVFERELIKEGKVATWRWLIGAFGISTYRRDDSIDVRYELNGTPVVASGLEIQSAP
jgi:hypothetical protein